MRALKLLAVLLVIPSLASAWGGYYGDHTPKKKKLLNTGDKISIGGGSSTLGSTGANGAAAASGVAAGPQGGTVASTATASSPTGAGIGTTVRSLLDQPAQTAGAQQGGTATTGGLTQGQIGAMLGNAGANLGGAGLGGSAGSGGCPTNMHSVTNGLGGSNCVAGAATQH